MGNIRKTIQTAVRTFIGKRILDPLHLRYAPPVPDPVWKPGDGFETLLRQVRAYSLNPPDRLFMLYQFARYAAAKEGDFAEVGVYRGGSARLLARACPEKTLHLFDTFEGMPETNAGVDHHVAGEFADVSLESVKAYLAGSSNCHFYPGLFPDTAGPVKDLRFALVYMDADIYESAKACLEFFYPRLVTGGVMVLDDYLEPECPGVARALNEFVARVPASPIATACYQCVLIKP